LKAEKLFVDGRTDVGPIPTDGRTNPLLMLLGRLGGVDLKIHKITKSTCKDKSIKIQQKFGKNCSYAGS